MRPKLLFLITFLFGLCVIAFGLYAFFHAKSVASLSSSLALGGALLGSAISIRRGKKRGIRWALLLALLLTAVFLVRYTIAHSHGKTANVTLLLACLSGSVSLFLLWHCVMPPSTEKRG